MIKKQDFSQGGTDFVTVEVPVGSKIITPDEQKTDAQINAERIRNAPLDPEYKPVDDISIPLGKSVILQPVKGHEIVKNAAGLYIPASAKNTVIPNEGIVISVGPACSEFIRKGLRYQYSMYADMCFQHTDGRLYPYVDEAMLFFCKPDPSVKTDMGVIPDRHLKREEKQKRQESWLNQDHKDDLNELDKATDKTKGKIKPVRNNLKN